MMQANVRARCGCVCVCEVPIIISSWIPIQFGMIDQTTLQRQGTTSGFKHENCAVPLQDYITNSPTDSLCSCRNIGILLPRHLLQGPIGVLNCSSVIACAPNPTIQH
eukprot:2961825-Amphidinium_carterae.1